MKPLTKYSPREVVDAAWCFTTDVNGSLSLDSLACAAALSAASRLGEVADRLNAIITRLDSLGHDGLHEILRDERTTRRRKRVALRKKRKAAREAAR